MMATYLHLCMICGPIQILYKLKFFVCLYSFLEKKRERQTTKAMVASYFSVAINQHYKQHHLLNIITAKLVFILTQKPSS